jgi:uncharacterized protein with NAD-binding domain and iron-sulfur cluster
MRKKVAILGGGVGAMCAVYQLTRFPDWQERFDITVYQMGWRLGGKCASGRNARYGQRIEEHGLHVWSGFYDNAIKLMKDCYTATRGMDGVFPSFDAAFKPFNNIVLSEQVNGRWIPWQIQPPGNSAVPGEGGLYLSPWDYLCMGLGWLKTLFEDAAQRRNSPLLKNLRHDELPQQVQREFAGRVPPSAAPTTHLHHLSHFVQGLPKDLGKHNPAVHAALLCLLDGARSELHTAAGELERSDDLGRRLFNMLDLGLAAVKGAIVDGVILEGFDVIDDYEISEWLGKHGAHPQSLQSACCRGIYDYAFGFHSGMADYGHRAIAAGTSLRGLCRLMFTYKGAYFFKMQGGMGDTVFTPMYKVLKQRGVKFKFFHKVLALKADAAGEKISRIRMQRQADLKTAEYQPLVRVGQFDCWPSEPDYAQLEQGEELRAGGVELESSWSDWRGAGEFELKQGKDFDEVILGISVGALPTLCKDLAAKDPRWDEMLRHLKTTRTLACQLWLKPITKALGWALGHTILTCYEENLDTWADMSHLLPVEEWPALHEPRSVAYFCGPMPDDEHEPAAPDPAYPHTQYEWVREHARQWLHRHGGWFWPKLFRDGAIDWDQFESGTGDRGEALFEQQYFRANIDPSERYVLSVPGSTRYRLRSDQSGFANLYLAGDWTYNGVNAGCVEAAAMSGMRAAAGLAGETLEIVGETDQVQGQAPSRQRPPELINNDAPNLPWPGRLVYGLLQTAGANALLPFPREVVQQLLPEGLELAPQTLAGPGQHPVVLFFGWQDKVRPNFSPLGMNYLEFIISVPYVRHADPALRQAVPGPFIYMPRLYLDKLSPVWLGVYAYGYRKALSQITADGDDYIVKEHRSGRPIVACSFKKAGSTGAVTDFPHMSRVQRAYSLPLISRTILGTWLYSYFDFALGQALVQPIDMTVKIYNSEATGLTPGVYKVPSIEGGSLGGFFMSTAASISNPFQSYALGRRIRRLADNPHPRLLPFG